MGTSFDHSQCTRSPSRVMVTSADVISAPFTWTSTWKSLPAGLCAGRTSSRSESTPGRRVVPPPAATA
ncbi:hypothetical protein AB0M79_31175 [Polymorphospora sp. NPDC051019]|uniref:hypothetical protein n=1 Tax=Polymorphospora sp. NPDC051019 TaxID=3155725 RepID=UPI003419D95A